MKLYKKLIFPDFDESCLQVYPGGKDKLLILECILNLQGEAGCLVFSASELPKACLLLRHDVFLILILIRLEFTVLSIVFTMQLVRLMG